MKWLKKPLLSERESCGQHTDAGSCSCSRRLQIACLICDFYRFCPMRLFTMERVPSGSGPCGVELR